MEISAGRFGLGLLALLISCGGGSGGGTSVSGPPSGLTAVGEITAPGPIGGTHSNATGDLMGAKGDSEALPAGTLNAKTACLTLISPGPPAALNPGSEAVKIFLPAGGTLKFLFQGTFVTVGSELTPLEINCSASEEVKGALLRIVWYSEDFTEPKYRDFPVEGLKDGMNVALSGFTPKSGDRFSFFFYDESYFITEIIDETTRKTAIRHAFAFPDFPTAATSPPSSDWKVISSDDVVYFSGIKRHDGKIMFHPMGSLLFSAE